MKGCARTLLLQLAGMLATAGAVMLFFRERHGLLPGRTIGVSLAIAFFVWMALGYLVGIAQPVRERTALRECLAGRRPADGKRTGVAGTIDVLGAPLLSPLTGSECVAYKYEISLTRGSGRNRHKSIFFDGIALVPSGISTMSGTYRLLAVPAFDFGIESVETGTALRHWTEYVKTAAFEPKPRRALEKQWTDDDGAYRSERRNVGDDAPIEECQFQEDLIRRGDAVYVYGLFSEARGGIVPHANWAKETRVMKGGPDSVLRRLRGRIVKYAIGSVVCAGIAYGIYAAYLAHVTR